VSVFGVETVSSVVIKLKCHKCDSPRTRVEGDRRLSCTDYCIGLHSPVLRGALAPFSTPATPRMWQVISRTEHLCVCPTHKESGRRGHAIAASPPPSISPSLPTIAEALSPEGLATSVVKPPHQPALFAAHIKTIHLHLGTRIRHAF
jgi:hypothetical protein